MKKIFLFLLLFPFAVYSVPTASRAYVDLSTNALAEDFSGRLSAATNGGDVAFSKVRIYYNNSKTNVLSFNVYGFLFTDYINNRLTLFRFPKGTNEFNDLTFSTTADLAQKASVSSVPDIAFPSAWRNAATIIRYDGPTRLSCLGGLTVSADGWPEGHPCFFILEPAGSYEPPANLHLLGYSQWPTNSTQAVIWRVGTNFYCNLISQEL